MISGGRGGGIIILVLILLNMFYGDRPWKRLLSLVFVIGFGVFIVNKAMSGEVVVKEIFISTVAVLFTFFILEVDKSVDDDL